MYIRKVGECAIRKNLEKAHIKFWRERRCVLAPHEPLKEVESKRSRGRHEGLGYNVVKLASCMHNAHVAKCSTVGLSWAGTW